MTPAYLLMHKVYSGSCFPTTANYGRFAVKEREREEGEKERGREREVRRIGERKTGRGSGERWRERK
jgi:hypothetical protein